MLVEELQGPRIHWPGQLPYYIKDVTKAKVICAESNKIYADRIDENVPIFTDTITIDPGAFAMPAALKEDAPEGVSQRFLLLLSWRVIPITGVRALIHLHQHRLKKHQKAASQG